MPNHHSVKLASSQYKHLLAKNTADENCPLTNELLHGHTWQVLMAAQSLLAEVANDLLRQLGLSQTIWADRLKQAVLRGAFIHDFGKANTHFQETVRWRRQSAQAIRHELLSAILCTQVKKLRDWLCPNPEAELVYRGAVLAASGHHLQTDKCVLQASDEITIYLNHNDFKGLLRLGQVQLKLGEPPKFEEEIRWILDYEIWDDEDKCLPELENRLKSEVDDWFRKADEKTKLWLAAVKALVVAADVAGSALPKRPEISAKTASVKDWIVGALNKTLTEEELQQLWRDRLGEEMNPAREAFQQAVETSEQRVTLVRAGCGAGKTVAAYRWAARRAVGRKLFFCYPTTGTTTQGFDDYVSQSKVEGRLIHSRSSVDLARIFSTPDDTQEEDPDGRLQEKPDLRLENLQTWEPPLTVCTVDTVLGLMQNNRRGLFSLPAFANAAFVFDEIHSYDQQLFGALLCFLKTFQQAPVMLMTASLPQPMLAALESVCGKLDPYSGPAAREEAERYCLRFIEENPDEQAWTEVKTALKRREKVLWIVNTVDRAISLYCQAKYDPELCENNSFKIPVHLYHSRFRYFERVEKHKAVVDSFKRRDKQKRPLPPSPVLAITTQVAEMSLDLSADLLVTDQAPPAALIQRLGRLNRDEDEPNEIKLALILKCADAAPYKKNQKEPSEDYLLTEEWLKKLQPDLEAASQKHLADALQEVYLNATPKRYNLVVSTWLDGLWRSEVGVLRDSEGTVPIVLERDIPIIENAGGNEQKTKQEKTEKRQKMRDEAIRRSLSIPARATVNKWDRLEQHKLFRIAKTKHVDYDPETGAQWK
jgi:CRISPR-associated endonuclease/helicase Cas3